METPTTRTELVIPPVAPPVGAPRFGRRAGVRSAGPAAVAHAGVRLGQQSMQFKLLLIFWFLMVWEVDSFLTVKSGLPFNRVVLLVGIVMLGMTAMRGHPKALYWPLTLFTAMHMVASVLATNSGLARGPFKYLLYIMVLFAASVTFLDTIPKAITVIKLYMLSFLWFGIQGLPNGGRVTWHSTLGNEDTYGPLMVIALPIAFFLIRGTTVRNWKWAAIVTFVVCLLGVVGSFARGAGLAGAAVLLFIILRSPNKLRSLGILIGAVIVALPLVNLVVPLDAYIAEMSTAGQKDDTRMTLWRIAFSVFNESPIVGVGANNYGVVGALITSTEVTREMWGALYYRGVHNPFLQVLAEEGIVGLICFFTMIGSVFIWTERLRTDAVNAAWIERGGGGFDLRMIALGIQGAMIAYVFTGIFYNQLYIHWLWTLVTIPFVLLCLTQPTAAAASPASVPTRRPSRGRLAGRRG
jgi:O-antigen ligase